VKPPGFLVAVSRGGDGLFLNVHLQPGAKLQRLCGLHGDAVKIAVRACAVDGKANKALLAFVARSLALSPHQVRLVAGQTSRRKRLHLAGDADALMRRLSSWLEHD